MQRKRRNVPQSRVACHEAAVAGNDNLISLNHSRGSLERRQLAMAMGQNNTLLWSTRNIHRVPDRKTQRNPSQGYMHACKKACAHACMRARMRACMHACMHACARMHARMQGKPPIFEILCRQVYVLNYLSPNGAYTSGGKWELITTTFATCFY